MIQELEQPENINTIEELEHEVSKVLLLEDKGIVRMTVAAVIANRMDMDAVWFMIVAPSSGGKTEIINALGSLDFIHEISDVTVNTFASGQKRVGKETSLLLKIQNGVMTFKDFTSIISKNKEAKGEIMKQLREIYDGKYVKHTGTGDTVLWEGKIGAIAGVTEVIYQFLGDMSAMGDRFIMYSVRQPDRIEVSARTLQNAHKMAEYRAHLKACFGAFIKKCLLQVDKMEKSLLLTEEEQAEMLAVADFTTRVRSAVITDFKSGLVDFVPSPEMPMRVTAQLYALGSALVVISQVGKKFMEKDKKKSESLQEFDRLLLHKTAFDSIPKSRRDVLVHLAKYRGGLTTAGLAVTLELPSPTVSKYLSQVNALGICTRMKKGGKQGDMWKLKEQFRDVIAKLEGIKVEDGVLISEQADKDMNEDGYEQVSAEEREGEIDDTLDIPL